MNRFSFSPEDFETVAHQYDGDSYSTLKAGDTWSTSTPEDRILWEEAEAFIFAQSGENQALGSNALGDTVDHQGTVNFAGCVDSGLEVLAYDAELEGEELATARDLLTRWRSRA